MSAVLYRHFDADDRLLYVGESITRLERQLAHSRSSQQWWFRVAYTTWEHFETKVQAQLAERRAIKTERPLYNKQHNNNKATDLRLNVDMFDQVRVHSVSGAKNARLIRDLGFTTESKHIAKAFRRKLIQIRDEMYPHYTSDALAQRPDEAIQYCGIVRRRLCMPEASDEFILRNLMQKRKGKGDQKIGEIKTTTTVQSSSSARSVPQIPQTNANGRREGRDG